MTPHSVILSVINEKRYLLLPHKFELKIFKKHVDMKIINYFTAILMIAVCACGDKTVNNGNVEGFGEVSDDEIIVVLMKLKK
jgi:hypothetical protein